METPKVVKQRTFLVDSIFLKQVALFSVAKISIEIVLFS